LKIKNASQHYLATIHTIRRIFFFVAQKTNPGFCFLAIIALVALLQPVTVEILTSVEHTRMPAVFGTTIPPSGLSANCAGCF
jgi:NAD/NADP transhydrogenase beta subunit